MASDSYSIIENGVVGCGSCYQEFRSNVPRAINARTDPELAAEFKSGKFVSHQCPHCGQAGTVPYDIIYHDPDEGQLLFAVPDGYLFRYQMVKRMLKRSMDSYRIRLPRSEAMALDRMVPRILPGHQYLFLVVAPELVTGSPFGFVHFSPNPVSSISDLGVVEDWSGAEIPAEYVRIGSDPLATIARARTNVPRFYEDLWSLIEGELPEDGRLLFGDSFLSKRPIETHGLPELLVFLGTSVILPVFLGVVSNLLTSLVLKKRETKRKIEKEIAELQENSPKEGRLRIRRLQRILPMCTNDANGSDRLCLVVSLPNERLRVRFEGTLESLALDLGGERVRMLSKVFLPGDCHVVVQDQGKIIDVGMTGSDEPILDFEAYKSRFHGSTRVRISLDRQDELSMKSLKANEKAVQLLRDGHPIQACEELETVLVGEATTVDTLYNLAQIHERSGDIHKAAWFLEQMVIRALNLPSIEEVNDILIPKGSKQTKQIEQAPRPVP